MMRACCPDCGTTMPVMDLCWLHDRLWRPRDERLCRLCCQGCREAGEADSAEMPGTLIFAGAPLRWRGLRGGEAAAE